MDPDPETIFRIFDLEMAFLDSGSHPDGSGMQFCSGLVVSDPGLVVSDPGLVDIGGLGPQKEPSGIEPSPGLWQVRIFVFSSIEMTCSGKHRISGPKQVKKS